MIMNFVAIHLKYIDILDMLCFMRTQAVDDRFYINLNLNFYEIETGHK